MKKEKKREKKEQKFNRNNVMKSPMVLSTKEKCAG